MSVLFFPFSGLRVCVLTLLIWLHDNFPDLLQLTIRWASGIGKIWASIWLPSAFTFRSKIINISLLAHAEMCSNFHNKQKSEQQSARDFFAISNHLNTANWWLFLNSVLPSFRIISGSQVQCERQSNSDLNFRFVELSQLSNETIFNYKQTFSAYIRWVQ